MSTTVKEIRDLVKIPETAADYYGKETLPQCKIHSETENFIVFIWYKGYFGPAGDWSLVRIYAVHKSSQKWCQVVELDQTWGGTWWKIENIEDHDDHLNLTISAHCKSTYETVTDYDREIFEVRVSDSEMLEFSRKQNPVVEEELRLAAEKKLAGEQAFALKSALESVGDAEISDVNLAALAQFRQNGNWPESTTVVSPDLVICTARRHLNSGSAGMGYFSQVHVWYKGQAEMKEWQWRDCYSADRDRPELSVHGIGQVVVKPMIGLDVKAVEVRIELLNKRHGSRHTVFTFEDKEANTFPELSEQEQAEFANTFQTEMDRVLSDLEERWTWKNQMFTSQGYVSYERPAIQQSVLDAKHGIGAFVTKEQIDHREGGNRQTRFELLIMKAADDKSRQIFEDHGYEKTEGARAISIISLAPDCIQVGTHGGPKSINIG